MSNLQNARVRSSIMGVAQECKDCERGDCPEYCAEMVQVELDEIIDSVRKEATDTLEQRYQQLAEVAREMYKAVEPMHESCNEDTCLALIDEGWPSDACLYDFRKRLEELGVEV